MSTEEEVRRASRQFYAGLNRMANGSGGALKDIWSHSPTVTTLHPIGGRQVGWDAVRESFDQVAQLASDGNVEIGDQLIQVEGDLAYEVGVERGSIKLAGQSGRHRAARHQRLSARGRGMENRPSPHGCFPGDARNSHPIAVLVRAGPEIDRPSPER